MGSLGGEVAKKKKAMWLYPKVSGINPPERWGHSACYSNGSVYVFGGCYGGHHFGDVMVLNLEKMEWSFMVTNGRGPGPRDSHSAVVVGDKMLVFGGTNGHEKVNDVHILDLRSKEWTSPECCGTPPAPRESHSATLVGDDKLVVFGGSGEGESNYLNDLHVLELKTMRWTSPETRRNGNVFPAPRDSHSAICIGNRLFLYGGDSGDRYQGDVDVLDMDAMAWSRMDVQSPFPGARAGHASVNIGTKMYVLGGVAQKQFYNDVWVLDVPSCTWTRIEVRGLNPQGRFSHTAVVTNSDIAIYGGCGEDERPLNELLILQLGSDQINALNKMPQVYRSEDAKRSLREAENSPKEAEFMSLSENFVGRDPSHQEQIPFSKKSIISFDQDAFHLKRRRRFYCDQSEGANDLQEHPLSLSQSPSPSQSQSEQEQKATPPKVFPILNHFPTNPKIISIPRTTREHPNHSNSKPIHLHQPHASLYKYDQAHFPADHEQHRSMEPVAPQFHNLIGADVRGKVDGAFDSGYLMTATINGKTFRGVLFAPAPVLMSREVNLGHRPQTQTRSNQVATVPVSLNHGVVRQPHPPKKLYHSPEYQLAQLRRANSSAAIRRSSPPSSNTADQQNHKNELLGVVLSLGGPGNGDATL